MLEPLTARGMDSKWWTHEDSPIQWVAYITPIRLNSLQTITMQIMLIRIPTGPFFTFDEGFMLIRNIPTLCDFLYDIYIYNGREVDADEYHGCFVMHLSSRVSG